MLKKIFVDRNRIYILILENLKMENAPLFFEDFQNLDEYLNKKVFLDLSLISFIDSSGIGVLIRCSEYLKERNSKLFIVNIKKSIESVFRLAGLNQIFTLVSREDLSHYFSLEELVDINNMK